MTLLCLRRLKGQVKNRMEELLEQEEEKRKTQSISRPAPHTKTTGMTSSMGTESISMGTESVSMGMKSVTGGGGGARNTAAEAEIIFSSSSGQWVLVSLIFINIFKVVKFYVLIKVGVS